MNITNTPSTCPQVLLDSATPGTGVTSGTSKPFQVIGGHRDVCITYTSIGTTSGGTILIEESDNPNYTGTWSQIASTSASSFTGGAKLCVHVQLGAGLWVRVRVSSSITGGGTILASISAA